MSSDEAAAAKTLPTRRAGGWFYACVLAFALGALAGAAGSRLVPWTDAPTTEGEGAWRAAMATNLDLTTSQALAGLPRNAASLASDLIRVGGEVGVVLNANRVSLPGRAISRVDLYYFEGAPLAQVAYFDPENGPIAFCVLSRKGTAKPPGAERREGMNLVAWSSSTHAFMVAGRAPPEVLQDLAAQLAGKVSS